MFNDVRIPMKNTLNPMNVFIMIEKEADKIKRIYKVHL